MANTAVVIEPNKTLHVDDVNTPIHQNAEYKTNIISLLKEVSKDKKKDSLYDRLLRRDARDYIKLIKSGKQALTPEFMNRCSFVYHMLKSLEEISNMTQDELNERIDKAQLEMATEDLLDE